VVSIPIQNLMQAVFPNRETVLRFIIMPNRCKVVGGIGLIA